MDNILYTGAETFIELVESALKQFRAGGAEILTQEKGTAYTGLEIQLGKNNQIALPHKQ